MNRVDLDGHRVRLLQRDSRPARLGVRTATRERFFTNRRVFVLHGWLGVALGLMLFLVCFSGSIAALSNEIDWLCTPAMRVPTRTHFAGWGAMNAAVQRAFPNDRVLYLSSPLENGFAAEAMSRTSANELRRVFVDPLDARILGESGYLNVQRIVRDFHRELFLGDRGLFLVTSFAFVLAAGLATGLYLQRRNWHRIFRLRDGGDWRLRLGDAHRMIGVSIVPFAAMLVVTGVWYMVELALIHAGHPVTATAPVLDAATLSRLPPGAPMAPIDAIVASAQSAFPDLHIRSVALPTQPEELVCIDGQTSARVVRDRANQVFVDPYDAHVVAVWRAEDIGVARRWEHTVDRIHFGNLGGVATKLLWSLHGIALSFLIVAGAVLRAKRILNFEIAHPDDGPEEA